MTLAKLRVWKRIVRERLAEPLHLSILSLSVLALGSTARRAEWDLVVRQQYRVRRMSYRSHRHRRQALPHWVDYYNRLRPHISLGAKPPISRIHNLRGQDS